MAFVSQFTQHEASTLLSYISKFFTSGFHSGKDYMWSGKQRFRGIYCLYLQKAVGRWVSVFCQNSMHNRLFGAGVEGHNFNTFWGWKFINSFIFHFIHLQVQPMDVEIVIKCCTMYLLSYRRQMTEYNCNTMIT